MVKLKTQKRLAAQIMGIGEKKVRFAEDKLQEIKEAITKADIRSLIKSKLISKKHAKKKAATPKNLQKKGRGGRKGTKKARSPTKEKWMLKVRSQRKELKKLKEEKDVNYRKVYRTIKSGFYKSKKHMREQLGVKNE